MNFHADTRVIQGKTLRAVINAASINDMLCILTQGAGVERFKKRKIDNEEDEDDEGQPARELQYVKGKKIVVEFDITPDFEGELPAIHKSHTATLKKEVSRYATFSTDFRDW
ncbi:hypothetical protein SUGI_0831980 [Cryptomeria japonica]|nr:hypothetical protein SUGI_0831980 [Cryptomeria japonica]